MSSTKNIAKNSLFLYLRMFLNMVVGLFTAGITLNVLGITDFGIYSVVGGFVSMFGFLNASMSQATQRFLSFDLGRNDEEQLRRTFSTTITVHFVIAIIIVLSLETFGLWYINNRLNVPANRLQAINIIYQFSVLSTFLGVIQVPYNALITAHERFNIYAYISFLEIAFKLVILFLIVHISYDKLVLYSFLLFCSSFIIRMIYRIYSRKNFPESKYEFYFDKAYFKTLLSFTGWSLYGQLSNMAKMQAITLLLNQTFNPAVVAARAIATNVSGQVNVFSGGFNASLYPPIIKSYSAGKMNEMHLLLYRGSKMSFFLMWILALPLVLEMPIILKLWLKNPPVEAALFSRLAIVESLILSISLPITAAARAPGKMKKYELILGTFQILIFFVSWWVLSLGFPAYSVYIVAIFTGVIMFFIRLILVKELIGLSIWQFTKKALIPSVLVMILSSTLSFLLYVNLPETIMNAFFVIIVAIVVSGICMYFVGLDREERIKLSTFVSQKISKIRR